MIRQRLVASLTRRYPLYSGCGSLANAQFLSRLTGSSSELAWARTPGGYKMLVPLDDYVGRAVYFTGDLDPKVTWVCQQMVVPGDTVLDIGANMGVVTMTLSALVGPTGTVHAFEPNPRMQELLGQSFAKNNITNVRLHKLALGDVEATLDLHIPASNAGAGSLARTRDGDRTLTVPVKTLSSVLDPPPKSIKLVKIDVEGYEPNVLRGATELFRKCNPDVILFEINEYEQPVRTHPTFALLKEMGYAFFALPRCTFRMRLDRFDTESPNAGEAHDFVAVANDHRFESIARRLNVPPAV